jgi:predicted dienelactone hydrolase
MPTFLSRLFLVVLSLAAVACLLRRCAIAQQELSVARADGRSTPLMLYPAENSGSGCAPLAVISHGAGGSEKGYRYLAEAMAHLGFMTVVMGHEESGLDTLEDDMRRYGVLQGLTDLVADPQAEQARLLDTGAALKWADSKCRAPFRVLLGHSMGAETVMLEAGAKNIIGAASPPAGQNRFDAYIALSPEGPGVVFPLDAWSGIHKPMLILTGTRDQSLKGGPEARLVPWSDLPGIATHCQWLGVIDGATHMNFAGSGLGRETVEPLVSETITEFLAGVRKHSCSQPVEAKEIKVQIK